METHLHQQISGVNVINQGHQESIKAHEMCCCNADHLHWITLILFWFLGGLMDIYLHLFGISEIMTITVSHNMCCVVSQINTVKNREINRDCFFQTREWIRKPTGNTHILIFCCHFKLLPSVTSYITVWHVLSIQYMPYLPLSDSFLPRVWHSGVSRCVRGCLENGGWAKGTIHKRKRKKKDGWMDGWEDGREHDGGYII